MGKVTQAIWGQGILTNPHFGLSQNGGPLFGIERNQHLLHDLNDNFHLHEFIPSSGHAQ